MVSDPFGPPPTGPPTLAPDGAPPPPSTLAGPTPAPAGGRVRPWWGLGDALLSLPFILFSTIVASAIGGVLAIASGSLDLDDLASSDTAALPASLLAASLVGQQLGQAVWPWIVSRWKGRGMASDWGWAFRPVDLLIGPAAALVAIVLAVTLGALIAEVVGVEEQVSNTGFLDDAEGTLAYWILIFGVAVGAPVSEELLFRGLILRALEKRAGAVVAVIGSTIAFTLPHYIAASPSELAVLLGTIGSVGLVLGIVAIKTRRLAPVIIAHVLFNGLTVVTILAG